MDQYFAERIDGIEDLADGANYPMTADELITEFGALEVQYPNGEAGAESLKTILERVSPDVYETPQEALLAVSMGVSADAVGRRYYSDRDPPVLGAELPSVDSF